MGWWVLSLIIIVNTSVDILRSSFLNILILLIRGFQIPNTPYFICPWPWNVILPFTFHRSHLLLHLQLLPLLRHLGLVVKPFPVTPVLYGVRLFPGSDQLFFIKRLEYKRFWVTHFSFGHRFQFNRFFCLTGAS